MAFALRASVASRPAVSGRPATSRSAGGLPALVSLFVLLFFLLGRFFLCSRCGCNRVCERASDRRTLACGRPPPRVDQARACAWPAQWDENRAVPRPVKPVRAGRSGGTRPAWPQAQWVVRRVGAVPAVKRARLARSARPRAWFGRTVGTPLVQLFALVVRTWQGGEVAARSRPPLCTPPASSRNAAPGRCRCAPSVARSGRGGAVGHGPAGPLSPQRGR
jgi:hypothetical protein